MNLAGYWQCKLLLCYCNWLCLLAGALSLLIDIYSSARVNIVPVSFFFPDLLNWRPGQTISYLTLTYFIWIREAYKLCIHICFKLIFCKCELSWDYLPFLVYLLYWELKEWCKFMNLFLGEYRGLALQDMIEGSTSSRASWGGEREVRWKGWKILVGKKNKPSP
jgi:hypothetical protein